MEELLAKFLASVRYQPDDKKGLATAFLIGGLGLAGYTMMNSRTRRNIDPTVDIPYPVRNLNYNPTVRERYIKLMAYHDLAPFEYRQSIIHADNLLFLEKQIANKKLTPSNDDLSAAWRHYILALENLLEIQNEVKSVMGESHGLTANIQVEKIYAELMKHFINIMRTCGKFNPEDMLERAQYDIEKALKRNVFSKERKRRRRNKWEKYKRESRRHHKQKHSQHSKD